MTLIHSLNNHFIFNLFTFFSFEIYFNEKIYYEDIKKKWISLSSKIYVITGFIASKEDGTPTNLGRNGSDYSAAIFASLFNAQELIIWTDVDGVLSADPNKVKNARLISSLSYNEAMELGEF